MGIAKSRAEKPAARRGFALHWGKGVIEEEARIAAAYHHPAVQLLKFTEGPAQGTREIRFCYYDHRGRFQRSPLIIDEADIPKLRQALQETPRLKRLLRKLLAD